jgi:orsellinic acid C2-O-methyltransferase
MSEFKDVSNGDRPGLVGQLLEMVYGNWMSQAVCVAAELGIADLLANGPKRIDELATATSCHAPSLQRLMRALTSLEICSEQEDGFYALTAMGSHLRTDAANSVRSWIIWWGKYLWPVWANLAHSIKTGEEARSLVTGARGFAHLERDAGMAATFNEAMVELTRLVAQAVVRSYDFSGIRRIVDVGGGHGELLVAVLKANSGMRGVLVDLPHAIGGARQHLARLGMGEHCELVEANFFDSVPAGADAYLLKSVLHEWDDEHSAAILRNCRKAMPEEARLLLIEHIMPERMEASPFHRAMARLDLSMLVAHGAQERTEAQFRRLLGAAGFRVARIVPTGMNFNIIEGIPC